MPDRVTAFCIAFALLGVKLLFYSDQDVSVGSVFLTTCVAAAVAFAFDRPVEYEYVERERAPY